MSLGLAQGISEGMGAAQSAMISGVAGVTSGAIGASSYALSNYGSINVQLTGEQATARSFLEDLGVMMGA